MFGLFGSKPFNDPSLGLLKRSGGYWRGKVILPVGAFPLEIVGDRSGPHPEALNQARELPPRFNALAPVIEFSLFEHFYPYKEAIESGELPGDVEMATNVRKPVDVWPHVWPAHVRVEPQDGVLTLEIGFRVSWDTEHLVGARFQGWQFLELCGSV